MIDLKHVSLFESFENINDLSEEDVERMFDLSLIDREAYLEWMVDHGHVTDDDTAIVEVGTLGREIPGVYQPAHTIWFFRGKKALLNSSRDMKTEILTKMRETGAKFVYVKDLTALFDDKFRELHVGKITPFQLKPIPKAGERDFGTINESGAELTREEADHLFDRKLLSASAYYEWMRDHDQFTTENTATVKLPLIPGKKIILKLGEMVEVADDPFAGVLGVGMSINRGSPEVAENIAEAVKKLGSDFYYITNNESVYTINGDFLEKDYMERLDIEMPSEPSIEHSIVRDFDTLMKLYDDGLIDEKALYQELLVNGHLIPENVALVYLDEERIGSFYYTVVAFDGMEEKIPSGNDPLKVAKKMGARIACYEYPSTRMSTEHSKIVLIDGTVLSENRPKSLIVPERWVNKKMKEA